MMTNKSGDILIHLRLIHNKSVDEVATDSRIPPNSLVKMEKGDLKVSSIVVRTLSKYANVEFEVLWAILNPTPQIPWLQDCFQSTLLKYLNTTEKMVKGV